MRVDPIGLFHRVRDECGDIGRFRLADRDVVLVSGAEANEQFFRAPDSTLDQAAAYPFMTPIFGKGVVFDAIPEERQQMLKNQALRGDMMRGHAATIEAEINRMVAEWGDEGEIDLLDWFAELTIYTTSSCLIGKPFREELDASFAQHYHELERGTDALAYVDPYADIESFRRRDAAREKLVGAGAGDHRQAQRRGARCRARSRDLLDVLISIDMTADYITGIFISMMFAGHHTSSGTAAWALIELMRHPEVMEDVVAELDDLYADGARGLLPGAAVDPAPGGGAQGDAAAAPAADHPAARGAGGDRARRPHHPGRAPWSPRRPRVSNRIAEDFPEPGAVRPRPLPRPAPGGPAEPLDLDPLRRRQAPLRRQRVRDDAAQGDLLGDPARLRVRDGPAVGGLPRRPSRRWSSSSSSRAGCATGGGAVVELAGCVSKSPVNRGLWRLLRANFGAEAQKSPVNRSILQASAMRVVADLDLCQAHQMCQGEAPEVFGFDEDADRVVVLQEHPDESLRTEVQAAVTLLPGHGPVDRREQRGELMSITRAEIEEFWETWLEINREAERLGDWRSWPTGTPRTRRTAGCTRPTSTSWPSAARRSATRDRQRDGRPRRLALRLPVHDDRRGQGHGARLLEAAVRDHRRRRPARSTRSSASAAPGSASSGRPTGASSSAGSATGSTSARPRTRSSRSPAPARRRRGCSTG